MALAYLDLVMSEYGLSYAQAFTEFPVAVGFELLKARRERLGDDSAINAADTATMRARNAERARLETEFDIIEPEPEKA